MSSAMKQLYKIFKVWPKPGTQSLQVPYDQDLDSLNDNNDHDGDDFLSQITKYQDILDSDKYAESNSEALAIKKLVDSALNVDQEINGDRKQDADAHHDAADICSSMLACSLDGDERVVSYSDSVGKQNGGQAEPANSNDGTVQPTQITRKSARTLLVQQMMFTDDLDDEGYLPGQPVYIPPKFNKLNFILPYYDVPRWIYNGLLGGTSELEQLKVFEQLTYNNYVNYFQRLLWIEETFQCSELRSYDLENILLSKYETFFSIVVPGLAEGRPSLLVGDTVYLKNNMKDINYEGFIHIVREKEILVKLNQDLRPKDIDAIRFDVKFKVSRTAFRRCHFGVQQFNKCIPANALFPDRNNLNVSRPLFHIKEGPNDLDCFFTQLNEFQRKAVVNMLKNVCRPMPYILFGPPGTGKTVTLVEAILQVYKRNRHAKILVAGNSNASVDLLTEKLKKSEHVHPNEMIRVSAFHRLGKKGAIPDYIKELTMTMEDIDEQIWKKSKIILSTCCQSGAFNNVGRELFDFIFIDESGHAQEPEALISLSLLKKGGASVIAGDPYQLGPVVISPIAKDNGLGESILERLFKLLVDDQCPEFDERFITKLQISYRSDPRVMVVNNKLFYNNELTFKNQTPKKWLGVLGVEFPLIFCEVKGRECREYLNPSWFNPREAITCLGYIFQLYKAGLKPNMLGFITPYRQQMNKMSDLLSSTTLEKCKMGTMEEFQGVEREVIVISTVRTEKKNLEIDKKFKLGFLNQEKRFNVGISRAMWIVIVVGDPEILKLDARWSEYMDVCKKHGSYIHKKSALEGKQKAKK